MITYYLKYLFKSHNRHGLHSPFIYNLSEKVLNKRVNTSEIAIVKQYRNYLKHEKFELTVDDLGSGSHVMNGNRRRIKDIYATSSTNRRMGEILHQIIQSYQCKNILEMGTSLGVGTAYIQNALKLEEKGQITTIEGSKELHDFTRSQFDHFFPNHKINFVRGGFDTVLPKLLETLPPIDLAFVDGNHTYAATLHYFNLLTTNIHNESIIIFDDIHWSNEMKQAWQEIKQHPSVRCSIDLFRWGILFFREEMRKEDFTIRFDGFLQAHISK